MQILTAIMFLSVIALMVYAIHITRDSRLKRNNENLSLQNQLMKEHYDSLVRQIEMTNEYRGRIEEQIEILKDVPKDRIQEAMQTYEESLAQLYETLKQTDYCNNHILDAVIHSKLEICKEKNITTEIKLNNMQLAFADENDMIMLFCDLFSYGIRRCEQSGDPPSRILKMACENSLGHLIIIMSCSCGKSGRWKRYNQNENGYNELKNIQNIVGKYDGILDITSQDYMESLAISIRNDKQKA